jgi:hypothetical protein
MESGTQKVLAGFLVVAGLIQAVGFYHQNGSVLSLMMILGGIGYALAGVAFWFEV